MSTEDREVRNWPKRKRIAFYARRIEREVLPKIESKVAAERDWAIHRLAGLVNKLHQELAP